MTYEKLLKEAYGKLPDIQSERSRFEIPKVRGHMQGNKTIISNFFQIITILRRKPEHVIKFLTKELAVPITVKKTYIIFGTKIPASRINDKIEKYAEEFVLCKECGKPDTKLLKEDKYLFMKCLACGSRKSVNN